MTRADQAADHQAGRFEHTAHFAVTPFGERDVIPVIGAFAAAVADAQEVRRAVVQLDAMQQLLTHAFGQLADHPHRILTLDAVTRVHEAVRQIARRGQHQQTFRVEIEAADREPLGGFHRRQLVEHRRTAFRVGVADDFAGRFVIQEYARRLVGELALDRLAVDADLVGRHDALADVSRLAVHRHAAGDDQFFHVAARTHARFGQHLVQLRRVVVRDQHALGRSRLATAQHRRAHAAGGAVVRIERGRGHVREQVVLARFRGGRCRRFAAAAILALAGFARLTLALTFTRRAFALTTLALRAARLGVAPRALALGARILARHAHLRDHFAVRRRLGDDRRPLRGRAFGALRLRSGAAPRDQAARSATQAAARTVFTLCFRGLRRALVLACRRLRGARFVGPRRRHGALGFGRIGVVGMCQNNLKMSGRARPLRARQKKVRLRQALRDSGSSSVRMPASCAASRRSSGSPCAAVVGFGSAACSVLRSTPESCAGIAGSAWETGS
ncbi:hypothetical protein LMG28614_02640 [Paraburkholderia ultramafica]|uniref:Uncharacterized protein n=1 Tax=Paraburkholderia ultramafica TaxID=1544867 RepID=A0A6S7B7B4_9BURK|nr:hypothetical protein LMG28614_02640 [Paraburkholderia ultramafica]